MFFLSVGCLFVLGGGSGLLGQRGPSVGSLGRLVPLIVVDSDLLVDQSPVLFHGQVHVFCVRGNWPCGSLLLLLIAELLHEFVVEGRIEGHALTGVELQQSHNQVDSIAMHFSKPVPLPFHILQSRKHSPHIRALEGLNVCRGGVLNEAEYFLKLVDLGVACEDWLAGEHLGDDAADAPEVSLIGVGAGAEQHLRGAVPAGGHLVSEHAALNEARAQGAHQPEIADLELALGVDQQVGRLEVPVQQPGRVQVLHGLEQLVDQVPVVHQAQLVLLYRVVQVALHELEHQVQVLVVLRTDHLVQLYYVRVLHHPQHSYLPVGSLRVR